MNPSKSSASYGSADIHNQRFLQACEFLKENAEKFRNSQSESSEEEIMHDILENTLSNYPDSDEDTSSLTRLRESLTNTLSSGGVVCLICIEPVRRHDKVWSCQECFCMLHINCIQKWAKDSMHYLNVGLEDTKKENLKWFCPQCRYEYEAHEKPEIYYCFCGKVQDPLYSPWYVPHSCGQNCKKKLDPDCGHTCSILCHPGPCPPCPQTVLVSCCCLKSEKVSRRCSRSIWCCDKPCGKLLSCQIHKCEVPCHEGRCPTCGRRSNQKCQCGLFSDFRPCCEPKWQCNQICAKPLDCGSHVCEQLCHKEPCPPCPDSGPRSCPCGKMSVSLPCTENVLPCGDTCNKLLECELHRCTERCHYGPCGKCIQMRVMKCRCGAREKSATCSKEFLCDVKCKKRRDCRRHNCNRRCCLGNCPACEAICGRILNCGNHKCGNLCHPGPCYPCQETFEITCNCGYSKFQVPCGRKKSAVLPTCPSFCKLPANCHHKERHKHKCHSGSCPQCRLICGKVLKCGHTCAARCHSAVPTKVDSKQKMDGPWDLLNSNKMEMVCKPCPPCMVKVPVTCLGNHVTSDVPCHQVRPMSCGSQCGRILSCGNHACSLECHKFTDDTDQTEIPCESCNNPCQKMRLTGCNHPCLQPCHPGSCSPCKQHIKLNCHCKLTIKFIVCSEWFSADEEKKKELLTCSNRCPREMECGHRCILQCHVGDCSHQEQCKKKVVLKCPCEQQKKDVQCFTLKNKNATLLCNNDCFEYAKSLKALEKEKTLQKEAQEKMLQEKELQEFLKKSEGKKKKKRKVIESNEKFQYPITNVILFSAFFLCIGFFLFYLYKT